MHHFIGKQIIEIKKIPRADAFQWQQRISNIYWNHICDELERVFDRISSEEELEIIDKIEIDLGHIREAEIRSGEWVKKIIKLLEETIQKTLHEKTTNSQKSHTASRGIFEKWLQFLQIGNLPYQVLAPNSSWKLKVLETLGLDQKAAQMLRQVIAISPDALERLVIYHDTEFLVSLVELLSAKSQKNLARALQEIKSLWKTTGVLHRNDLKRSGSKLSKKELTISDHAGSSTHGQIKKWLQQGSSRSDRALEISFWKYVMVLLAKKGINANANHYLKIFFQEVEVFHFLATIGAREINGNASTYPILKNICAEITDTSSGGRNIAFKDPGLLSKNSVISNDTSLASSDSVHKIAEKGIYVPYAGVVILYPFIRSFLDCIKLLEDGIFPEVWHQHKAAKMIYFLATGSEQPVIFDLALAKLLTGMPIQDPMDCFIKIGKEEKLEATNLLETVIAHWGCLGNSSPDGLREGYLMRDGKLTHKANGWHLQVERKTIDILLDRIPWGFNVIKYPWMEEMLFVEWN